MPAPKAFFRNTLPSDLEAIAAIGSGAVLEPIAGLAGLVGAALPGPQGQGAQWVRNVQDLAYTPDDPSTLQQIGSALQVPLEAYERGTNWLGDQTLAATGSPALASLAKSSPEILGGALGVRQLMKRNPGAPEVEAAAEPDMSRRKFLRDAGLLGAGAAVSGAMPGQSLLKGLDTISQPTATKTAATAAAKAIPKLSGGNFNLASFLASQPDVLKMIKKGEFEKGEFNGEPYINVVDPDGDVVLYNGPPPDKATLEAAASGKFEIDTDAIPRQAYHDEGALDAALKSFGVEPADFDNYSSLKQLEEDIDGPVYLFNEAIGNGIHDKRLHPADLKKAIQKLAKENPDVKMLQKLTELDNQKLLQMGSSNWQRGVMIHNGELDTDLNAWVYE